MVVGDDVPITIRAYDGSRLCSADSRAELVIQSRDAFRCLVGETGELGLARAYVAGELDIEGDISAVLEISDALADRRTGVRGAVAALQLAGFSVLWPLPRPPEEARLRGRLHSRARDAAAIAHHYDLSNDFYEILLGPSLTYSFAVWSDETSTLEDAQHAKHDLVGRKLGLRPGMRVLDIGSGWGSFVLHAARDFGARAVGITISQAQHDLAAKRVARSGCAAHVDVRLQDYRDVRDGPYDAIASIGMFEHVGLARIREYFGRCHDLLRPGGRLLNHAIARPAHEIGHGHGRRATRAGAFIDRYVFPDGELHEVGAVVSAMQDAGFEVRHLESLREHYARTLRCWVANLESAWGDAVALVGEGRARVWRLYLAAAAIGFDGDRIQVHQVLGVRTRDGVSEMPLRPEF